MSEPNKSVKFTAKHEGRFKNGNGKSEFDFTFSSTEVSGVCLEDWCVCLYIHTCTLFDQLVQTFIIEVMATVILPVTDLDL